MAKVIVINGVWSMLICGMLGVSAILFEAKQDQANAFSAYALDNPHVDEIARN